jgi:hypothetical protein
MWRDPEPMAISVNVLATTVGALSWNFGNAISQATRTASGPARF